MSFGFIILIIFGFFIFLLLIGVMFFYFYNKHGKTKDITTNKPLVMNFTEQGDNFIYTEEKTELIQEFLLSFPEISPADCVIETLS